MIAGRISGRKLELGPGQYTGQNIGVSPSGKAAAFDAAMRRFESCHPSQLLKIVGLGVLGLYRRCHNVPMPPRCDPHAQTNASNLDHPERSRKREGIPECDPRGKGQDQRNRRADNDAVPCPFQAWLIDSPAAALA